MKSAIRVNTTKSTYTFTSVCMVQITEKGSERYEVYLLRLRILEKASMMNRYFLQWPMSTVYSF